MGAVINVRPTLGAILVGCMVSVTLSGMVAVQTYIYFRMYRKDLTRIKAMVGLVWALDAIHTCLVCASTWDYLVVNFGDGEIVDIIPRTVALTIAFTAITTFIAHLFFSHRVLRLSKNNWFLTAPLVFLAFLRLGAALVTTIEMARLRSFRVFTGQFMWCFTLGLAASSVLDVLIACSLCFYLQTSRTGFGGMDQVIDLIMLYTINNGALTGVATVVSMICWLVMPHNLVFMGLHFVICKLYANSLLATLNARRSLRGRSQPSTDDHPLPVLFPDSYHRRTQMSGFNTSQNEAELAATKLQISVEKTVQYDVDGEPSGITVSHSP